jgi:hypothetical protein
MVSDLMLRVKTCGASAAVGGGAIDSDSRIVASGRVLADSPRPVVDRVPGPVSRFVNQDCNSHCIAHTRDLSLSAKRWTGRPFSLSQERAVLSLTSKKSAMAFQPSSFGWVSLGPGVFGEADIIY